MSLRILFVATTLVLATAPAAEERTVLPAMLNLPRTGTDPTKIDFATLPVLAGTHGVVSMGEAPWMFRLHSYLAHFDGKFWCMWSHGPVAEDKPTQHVRYSTSADGLRWSRDEMIAPPPTGGERYISRGLWIREGKLFALGTAQYPHVIEHGGALFVSFSRNDTSIEVVRVTLDEVARLRSQP